MGATSDNYDIVTSGTTYTIASDYVKPSGGETAHFQVMKLAYGADNSVFYTSGSSPLPVGLCGSWERYDYTAPSGYYSLTSTIVGITGTSIPVIGVSGGLAVGVTFGVVGITASNLSIRALNGGTVGNTLGVAATTDYVAVQGICGAYPVGITVNSALPVSLSATSNVGIFGVSGATAVGVTFSTVSIRGLTAASDTVTVYGGGTASTVSVGLFGFTGATAAPIYAENNALNVNVKTFGTGISGVTVSAADLDIRNLDYTADTVTVVGQGATDNATSPKSTVPTYINALGIGGSLLQVGGVTGAGWSAAALNVYMVNSGITFTVSASATFSSQINVLNEGITAMFVQGTTTAVNGVWVTGSTNGDPVSVRIDGITGTGMQVHATGVTAAIAENTSIASGVKNNTEFLAAVKKALYADSVSVGANDFPDRSSLYTLVRDNVGNRLETLTDAVIPNGVYPSTQDSIAVTLVNEKQQTRFMARTGSATTTPQNLTAFNAAAGYTCANGIRIKASRIATGTNASQNEVMCVISEADAATVSGVTSASGLAKSYMMYHGDEMFFEVDNINKLRVFYPAYSASFAPHNTGTGVTFSFYAS